MKAAGKKGATLAEMCIVLALVTIIATMVTSFATSAGWRTQLSADRLDMASDLDSVEAIADGWLGQMKLQKAELSVQGNDICAVIQSATYTLSFRDGVLEGTLPGEERITFKSNYVSEMVFSHIERATGEKDKLFFYTITYNTPGLPEDAAEQVQVFCINPRLGSTYAAANDPAETEGAE